MWFIEYSGILDDAATVALPLVMLITHELHTLAFLKTLLFRVLCVSVKGHKNFKGPSCMICGDKDKLVRTP